MFAIIMLAVGLLIPFCVLLAAQRFDVEDATANNKKPVDDETKQQNHLDLSKDMGRTREKVDEADRSKRIYPEPKQDHIQYLDQPSIRLMLQQAEKEQAEKARRSKGILWQLFIEHSQHRDVDRTPKPVDHHHSKERSRDRSRSL